MSWGLDQEVTYRFFLPIRGMDCLLYALNIISKLTYQGKDLITDLDFEFLIREQCFALLDQQGSIIVCGLQILRNHDVLADQEGSNSAIKEQCELAWAGSRHT